MTKAKVQTETYYRVKKSGWNDDGPLEFVKADLFPVKTGFRVVNEEEKKHFSYRSVIPSSSIERSWRKTKIAAKEAFIKNMGNEISDRQSEIEDRRAWIIEAVKLEV